MDKYIHTPMKTAELAEHCGLHPVYLSSLFRKHTGLSVKDYVNKARILKAKELIASGEYRISEAASQCGFEDALYFSKVFKKYTGISPSNYAQNTTNQGEHLFHT